MLPCETLSWVKQTHKCQTMCKYKRKQEQVGTNQWCCIDNSSANLTVHHLSSVCHLWTSELDHTHLCSYLLFFFSKCFVSSACSQILKYEWVSVWMRIQRAEGFVFSSTPLRFCSLDELYFWERSCEHYEIVCFHKWLLSCSICSDLWWLQHIICIYSAQKPPILVEQGVFLLIWAAYTAYLHNTT